jgi:TatA/E family protein of Tat protein translocase
MDVAFLSDTGIAVVAVLVVVIFGGSQLPKLARNLGLAGKEFRRAHDAAESEASGKSAASPSVAAAVPAPPAVGPAPSVVSAAPVATPAAPVATPAPPVATPAPPVATPAAQASPPDDRVTISKSELAALIEEREAEARRQASS